MPIHLKAWDELIVIRPVAIRLHQSRYRRLVPVLRLLLLVLALLALLLPLDNLRKGPRVLRLGRLLRPHRVLLRAVSDLCASGLLGSTCLVVVRLAGQVPGSRVLLLGRGPDECWRCWVESHWRCADAGAISRLEDNKATVDPSHGGLHGVGWCNDTHLVSLVVLRLIV